MNKFYLSAAAVAASLALPVLPAFAQTNETVHRHHRRHHWARPRRSAFPSAMRSILC